MEAEARAVQRAIAGQNLSSRGALDLFLHRRERRQADSGQGQGNTKTVGGCWDLSSAVVCWCMAR